MPLLRLSIPSATVLLGALFLSACGIRLPDAPSPHPVPSRQEVSFRASSAPHQAETPEVMVWLIADKLHTGMVFPYGWLIDSGFIPPAGFGSPKYVTLSWGDRTAYVEKGLHSPLKFVRALFTPTPSVMELIPTDWEVAEVCQQQRIWRKRVPRANGKALAAFLNDCSRLGADGKPQVVGTSSWGDGVLLESRHLYFIPRICNIWTVHAIENLGGTLQPWGALTANGLIRQVEKSPNDFEKIWPGNDWLKAP
jgi:hypothetical protein